MNELYRKRGEFSHDQLVIQSNDRGETYYFMLSETGLDGEAPIYCDGSDTIYANNFIDFIEKEICK